MGVTKIGAIVERVLMVEIDGQFVPDVPDEFYGTATLTPDGDYVLTRPWDPRIPAVVVAARLTVADKVRGGLDDETVTKLVRLFDPWQPALEVKPGEVYSWDGTLVECIQGHTTQADWTPDVTPALWKVHRTDDGTGPIPWQPGITVGLGEQVVYDGVTYEVLQGHTTQVGWEPPNVPALFVPV